MNIVLKFLYLIIHEKLLNTAIVLPRIVEYEYTVIVPQYVI
jgi:hypothetical protein